MRDLIRFNPAPTLEAALQRAAEFHRLEPSYIDNWGHVHFTPPEVQQGILASFGLDASSLEALNISAEEELWKCWNRLVAPTKVIGVHPSPGELTLHLPAAWLERRVEVLLRLENGRLERGDYAGGSLKNLAEAELRGQRFVRLQIPVFAELPLGYHQLTIRVGDATGTMSLIVGPEKAWIPEHFRTAGMAISLYGLRSETNWGAGDTSDLLKFGVWARQSLGLTFVGLNPLHAIHNRTPYNTSPYLPVSAYFRNPLYVNIESLPEYAGGGWAKTLTESPAVQKELAELRAAEYVEYERIWRLKKLVLRLLHRQLAREDSARRQAFRDYCDQPGSERRRAFATFCVLDEVIHRQHPDIWLFTEWPAEYQSPHSPEVLQFAAAHRRSIRAHLYAQWVLEQQLRAVQQQLREAGMTLGLYHDLALASDRFGFDVWYEKGAFAAGVRVGSPPDGFSPDGQDWAFPPPSPTYADENGYISFRDMIRANAQAGGALRFDHVMRFFRLYWIPANLSARQGAYIRNDAAALLRIIALESVRDQFLVIGEDLGTVTPIMRDLLDQFGILGYRLLIFEREGKSFRPPEHYPELAAASVTTHDLPTLAGFLTGADIEARRAAGQLSDEGSYQQQWADRREALEQLQMALDPATEGSANDLLKRVFLFLSSTKAAVFILNQEEITGEEYQQNLPGTTAEYPNWRRKMSVPLEQLDRLAPLCAWMKAELQKCGRL